MEELLIHLKSSSLYKQIILWTTPWFSISVNSKRLCVRPSSRKYNIHQIRNFRQYLEYLHN